MTTRDVDIGELVPWPRSARDFGLVVGIDHYPRFRSLQGAAADAIAFHAWMCDPDGGGVAPEHARLITSTPEPPTPLQDHVDEQVVELAQAVNALGGARRLYLYFSGHGASCVDGDVDDVALLLAKWSPVLARIALSSHRYCSALGGLGLFEEIAVFLDCCRSLAVGAVGLPPTFTLKVTPGGPPARMFVAYATEAGRPAFEQPQEGVWRGAFTQKLLWILKRSPQGIDAAALKDALERELRADAVQRAHVMNGLRAGSMFGRRGVPPTLQVKPDDEWEDDVELYDGTGRLVASHRPSDGTWTIPLTVGLYKLIYGSRGERSQKIVDHGVTGPTVLNFRPRLREPVVRVWSAAMADRWIPERAFMQVFKLSDDEPVYIGSSAECAIRAEGSSRLSCDARIRREDGCYVIEDLGGDGTLFHGRIQYIRGSRFSADGKRVRSRQLHDGDLFRCGELRLMVGHVEDFDRDRFSRGTYASEPCDLSAPRSVALDIPAEVHLQIRPSIAISSLSLRSNSDATVTVYDATGAVRARSEGDLEVRLPHGLYRIEVELFERAESHVIELDGDLSYELNGNEILTPAVATSLAPGQHPPPPLTHSRETTSAPLGAAPYTSRLDVTLRPWPPNVSLSDPVSLHDQGGHLVAELSQLIRPVKYGRATLRWLMACSCEVAPGTYYLRASRSQREVAITIPDGYAARVFVADVGVVRLDGMRVSIVPAAAKLNDHAEVARAKETVFTALHTPGRRLSKFARALLLTSVSMDLCFAVAAACLLARADERAALEEVLTALSPHAGIPDVAILHHAYAQRAPGTVPAPATPPLLRASLRLLMTHPVFDLRDVPADSALSRAACRGYADSIWCTWSPHADDERWIAPTVAELRRDEPDVIALGRRLGIPPRRVQQALDELDGGPFGTAS
ncbi:MAG TPA: caspase family protein [Kofleriaceae bacterium]|nr:caspase family protein [Kofleriaceae bacterium]